MKIADFQHIFMRSIIVVLGEKHESIAKLGMKRKTDLHGSLLALKA